MKINAYDFDGTIYDGDSSLDFYLFNLKKHKKEIIHLFPILLCLLKYKTKKMSMEQVKEEFFSFLGRYKNNQEFIKEFWDKHEHKIKQFFKDQTTSSDVIISASPTVLLEEIMSRLGEYKVIATEVDINTGKLLSKNCKGKEKIVRLKEIYKDVEVENTYTDSYSDQPLIDIAKNAYLVKKNKVNKIRLKSKEKTDYLKSIGLCKIF